jgi:hypothetical protein
VGIVCEGGYLRVLEEREGRKRSGEVLRGVGYGVWHYCEVPGRY